MFADASEDTMCAVAYLRSKPQEYSADFAFVIGKCRDAPMRHLSIPRLELQAAVMAVRLKEHLVTEHETKIHSCNFWTDSTTVLQWIHSSHRKQQLFVANRVAEILDTTNVSQWNYASGINNPADIGTRAINVDELKRSEWLTGPAWLKQRENEWPEQVNLTFASDKQNDQMVFSARVEEKKLMIQWERFSNFNRLVNTMAYVQRVFRKHKPATKTLSVEEKEVAQAGIFRLLQQEQFAEEMKSLKAEKEILKNSKILQFSPFIDQQGLIRAQGRIGKSQLNLETKHPILLHWKHHVVELLLRNENKNSHHEGTEHVRSIVQQKFWILGIRNALRSIRNKCIRCRKGRAQTKAPVMADLPQERLVASTVFSNVDVDFFVPFTVKVGRRNEKRWCCLFTCLNVRAVHIEILPKLDNDCCLNAIMRFIAQRGKPVKMISDNGTNFVEAEKELAEYIAAWNKVRIEEHPIQQGIRWKFNPPAAPHFGGVWERLVKNCKKAMYAVLGNRSVTEDVLSTTMCLVEQKLNARPLTQISSDATDLEAITQNHFLLGNKNLCLPYLSGAEQIVDHRKLFRQTQAYADFFWDRFRKQYLPTLNSRKKWQNTTDRSLQQGDLVWLLEDSDKRGYYDLGRIIETFEGSDGVIQSEKIQTKDGYYKRPVVKLAPLLSMYEDVFTKENRDGDVGAELAKLA